MYPRVPWVQRITVIKYGNTFIYLKTTNILQHDIDIEFYNCNYEEFFVSNLFIVFGNQRVTQRGPRQFMICMIS